MLEHLTGPLTTIREEARTMAAKKCTKCGEEKPLQQFFRQKASKDGHGPWCKLCMKLNAEKHRLGNPEQARRQRREWARRNKLKVNQSNARRRLTPEYQEYMRRYGKEWYGRNKERLKAVRREWYLKNKPEHNARSRASYYANPDLWHQRAKAWAEKNPERWREMMRRNDNKRRAIKAGACGVWTAEDVKKRFAQQRGMCAVCRAKLNKSFHRDHIVALSCGGSNEPSNLQLLCKSCNSKKHKKDPIKFMQENGYLL